MCERQVSKSQESGNVRAAEQAVLSCNENCLVTKFSLACVIFLHFFQSCQECVSIPDFVFTEKLTFIGQFRTSDVAH